MIHIKIACYSDIHHHEYTNGITGDDVVAIEDEFRELCRKEAVDFWIFGGDRFLSRNPLDKSRKNSDEALLELQHVARGMILVGNHDRWTKNPNSDHNFHHISLYPQDLNGLVVMDKAGTYGIRAKGEHIQIDAIPAGHHIKDATFTQFDDAACRILLFHDIVDGCRFTNGIVANEGIDRALLDKPEYDIVLGGDNHQPQDLAFKNTTGLYIGAPMQHNWGDCGSKRGFLIIDIILDGTAKIIKTRHIMSSAPQFIKHSFKLNSADDISTLVKSLNGSWNNNIVKLTLIGKADVFKGMQMPKISDKLRLASGARSVKISTEYEEVDIAVDTNVSAATTPDAEWKEYLRYKAADFAGLDIKTIEQVGLDIIAEADR